ncbi:MAG: hypothetical protein ACRDT4_13060 [Micromonosporaceae bacterium]
MSQRVPVPAHIAALNLLDRVDYEDAFTVRSSVPQSAEQWARLALEGAPPALRGFILGAHRALGLRLASPKSPDHVLGWEILQSEPDLLLLGTEGHILTPRIVLSTPPGRVVAATLIRFDRVGARAVWAVVAPIHRGVARYLLDRTAKRRRSGALGSKGSNVA